MNYWHMQLHPDDAATFDHDLTIRILKEKKVIGLGQWDDGEDQREQFINEMKNGDIVAIKNGGTPIALVKVVGDWYFEKNVDEDFDWFANRRAVKLLDEYKNEYGFSIPQARGTISICRNLDNPTSKTIINWYKMYMKNKELKDLEALLLFKKQIILQGPPGTGKTYQAKEIAKELTKDKVVGSPLEKIDDFFKNFDSNSEEVIKKREERIQLLDKFYKEFPKEKLKDLTLESYSVGTGTNDSFCWWIERGLQSLGYYFPGSARSYLIYWSRSLNDYSTHFKHSEILKNAPTIEDAMKILAQMISEFILTKNPKSVEDVLGGSFILKLLHSYYPEDYAPINSAICLKNCLKLLGTNPGGMNIIEMNLKVQEIYNDKRKKFKADVTNHEFMRFLFENFDLKGNVEFQSNEVIAKGEYKLIQFHPAYSYEDFVRGMSARTNSQGQVEYAVENKILADFAQKAFDNPSANYVLIIDEINRANLPSVLGELIYALEYRYDESDVTGTTVESMYALKLDKDDEEGDRILKLPQNLFIIGTMNTADRSVGHIDYAIRRRFAFVDVLPKEIPELTENGKKLFREVANLFCEEFREDDSTLKNSKYLAADFKPTDVILGHSYFLVKKGESETLKMTDDEILSIKLKYEIEPLLREYVKDGILFKEAEDEIQKLKVGN